MSNHESRTGKCGGFRSYAVSNNEFQMAYYAPDEEIEAFCESQQRHPVAERVANCIYALDYDDFNPFRQQEFLDDEDEAIEIWVPDYEVEILFSDGKTLDEYFSDLRMDWVRLGAYKFRVNHNQYLEQWDCRRIPLFISAN